ncbi:MAG: prepilin peptidase [Shimia sp.]
MEPLALIAGIETALPRPAAWLFLALFVPVWIWVAYDDMANLKIRNWVTDGLAAAFLVLGLLVFPLPDYGWQIVQGVVMLGVAFLLFAAGTMGGGDAKFIAAASP